MKNRIIFVLIYVAYFQLVAQKAQIDPYLRAANQAYGKSQTSSARTLNPPGITASRPSLRAVGIEAIDKESDN